MRARAGAHAIARRGRTRRAPLGPVVRATLMMGLVAALAGCFPDASGSGPPTSGPSGAPTIGPGITASGGPSLEPTSEPTTEASPGPSVEPTAGPTNAPSPAATRTPASSPNGSPAASGSPSSGAAGRCFGSSETRDFFVLFAQEVPWPVYCVVLPAGWSVEKGTYHLKDGGRLTISYRRRADGARVILDEGTVCQGTTPCVPPGSNLGQIPFGDRQATLVDGGTTGLVAAVDPTENPAWTLTGTGLGQSAFSSIAARLDVVDQ